MAVSLKDSAPRSLLFWNPKRSHWILSWATSINFNSSSYIYWDTF